MSLSWVALFIVSSTFCIFVTLFFSPQIMSYLQSLERQVTAADVTVTSIGRSFEKRDVPLVEVKGTQQCWNNGSDGPCLTFPRNQSAKSVSRRVLKWGIHSFVNAKCNYTYPSSSPHLSLNREGRWGATDDFTTSFFHFPCSPLPSETWRTPGLSIP